MRLPLLSVCLTLVLLGLAPAYGQEARRYLDFNDDPWSGWTGIERLASDGCMYGPLCASVDTSLEQTLSGVHYRDRAVLVTAWIRATAEDDGEGVPRLTLSVDGRFAGVAAAVTDDVGKWQRLESLVYVPASANALTVGLSSGAFVMVVDRVSLETLERPSTDMLPAPLEAQYHTLDRAYSDGRFDDLSRLLTPRLDTSLVRASTLQTRSGGARLESIERPQLRTMSTSLVGVTSSRAVVRAEAELIRDIGGRRVTYHAIYGDVWTHGPDGWTLRDAPAVSIHDVSRSQATSQRPPETDQARTGSPSATSATSASPAPTSVCGLSLSDLRRSRYRTFLRPTGILRARMVFVEFRDVMGLDDTKTLYEALAPPVSRWFATTSDGRLRVEIAKSDSWLKLDELSEKYWVPNGTLQRDAAAALRMEGVSDYDFLYIVPARGSKIPTGAVLLSTGVSSGFAVMFGEGSWSRNYTSILVHETLHLLGAPDLYFQKGTLIGGRTTEPVFGAWDIMSDLDSTATISGFTRLKLGWFSPSDVVCARGDAAEAVLSPLAGDAGTRILVVPVAADAAYFAELRRAVQEDASACEEGVLVYLVDVVSEHGGMRRTSGTVGQLRDPLEPYAACSGGRHALLTPDSPPLVILDARGQQVAVDVGSQSREAAVVRVTKSVIRGGRRSPALK